MIRKFFIKRFKKYLGIIMIPSLVLFIFIFGFISSSTIRSLSATADNSLENINDTFDLITVNAFHQQDLMTLNPQLSLSLRKILLFSATSYTDYVFLNSMKTILNSTTTSHAYVQSIYLYLDGYDSFFSSSGGVCSLDSYYDTSWLSLYREASLNDMSNYILSRTIPQNSLQGETQVISIYQKMSYLDGVIVANIPVSTFQENLKSVVPSWENHLFVLNSSQEILLSLSADTDEEDAFSDFFSNQPDDGDSSSDRWVTANHRLYRKNALYNTDYGLTFVLLTPASVIWSEILKDIVWPLLLIVADCFLILVLSFTTTKSNFSQIQYVIELFGNAEKGIIPQANPDSQSVENEYDLIMNNVIRLFLNTTFLNSQLAEQQYKKQVAELTALQLQINPHFMVNTLQTLDFEVQKLADYKPTTVNHIIHNLSDILMYSLAPVDSPVSLSDELENVRKYVQIQKYRFPDSFLVYEDVEDSLLSLPFKRLILQPLVENSISHGIRPLAGSRKGYVKIRIFLRRDRIFVSVIDNGCGMKKERLTAIRESLSSGSSLGCIGLDNVNKRLILHYGPDSALRILSREGMGCSISFSIPCPPQ